MKVVITGIGPVSSIGNGKETFWNNIVQLQHNITPIPESFLRHYNFKSRFYVPAPKGNLAPFGINSSLEKLMDQGSVLAVQAAYLALLDAGIKLTTSEKYQQAPELEKAAVIIGTGMSHMSSAFNSFCSHSFKEQQLLLKELGLATRFPIMTAPQAMANASAAWVSILLGIKGPSYTINTACSSGSYAICEAYKKIKRGEVEVALCGGMEDLTESNGSIMRAFDTLKTLTNSPDGNPRPFSPERSGFLYADGGSCLLLLEEKSRAQKRGATIYAEIVDVMTNSDAYNIFQIEPSGAQIYSLLKHLKADRQIDYLNTHGTATLLNDEMEQKVIGELFGNKERQPLINSTKGLLGHTISASGAFEAAVAALSIANQTIHGSLIETPLENLNLNLATRQAQINWAISTSYGFGGHNAGILFARDS